MYWNTVHFVGYYIIICQLMHGMITLYLDGIIFRQQKSSKLHGVHVKVYATTIT